MKVYIDVSTLNYSHITGIGNYIKYTAEELSNIEQLNLVGSYRLSRWRQVKQIKHHVSKLKLSAYMPGITGTWLDRCDVFHGPDFRIPESKHFKRVVTLHDFSYLRSEFIDAKLHRWGKTQIEKLFEIHNPDFVITDSYFVQNEITERYPDYADRVRTAYLGCNHLPTQAVINRPLDYPYILFVGSIEKRKNLEGIIHAFEAIKSSAPDLHLIMVGGDGSSMGYNDLIKWEDYHSTSLAVWQKKQKVAQYLLGKGFESEQVWNVLNELDPTSLQHG